jgi:hypothetical protein
MDVIYGKSVIYGSMAAVEVDGSAAPITVLMLRSLVL